MSENSLPSFGLETPPNPVGRAERLEPLVRRVLAGNPSAFTYTGTQTYLVGGADDGMGSAPGDVAVIDPGPNDADHLDALIAAIGDRRVTAICCTHTHRDHSPAAAPLKRMTGAPIVGCGPLAIDAAGPRGDAPFDRDYAPDRVLEDGETIAGAGWTLRAVATPGHTSNHLCYALEESGALFTGDHVMGWSTTVVAPPDGDMADYMRSMERLYARDDRVYYPAHGPQVDKPRQLVRGMIGHRRQRERQILRHLGDDAQAVPALVASMYVGLDPGLLAAAGQSVLAHLLDLERQGRVTRSGEIWTRN